MLLLLVFAFVAGIVTILSPCILPILPIVLSGSLTGGKSRPYGIVTGFVVSFTFFTLALTTIVKITGLPSETLRLLAVIVIFGFGLSLLLPATQVLLEKIMSKMSGWLPTANANTDPNFLSGLLVGASLGLIWAPCVGPILAAVITLALTSSVTLNAVLITLAYSLGTAIPMFFVIQGGRQLLQRVPWLLSKTPLIQKIFGVVMILTAIALYFNIDRQFQNYILQVFPSYGANLTKIEDNPLVKDQLLSLSGRTGTFQQRLPHNLDQPGEPAPEFNNGGTWLNSPPQSLETLKGKVVLVDFWTYSCINCIRTFPHLTRWYQKYKDKGFVIVGVHSPEFEFEKSTQNVEKAAADFGLTYPIVQDNDFITWQRYQNQYWPAHYLIDAQGNIRYHHFGEGEYEKTEAAIQRLLKEAGQTVTEPMNEEGSEDLSRVRTPETYLGISRIERFASEEASSYGEKTYSLPRSLPTDYFAYQGPWKMDLEYSQPSPGSKLLFNFQAKNVFLVITPPAEGGEVLVKLDGQPVTTEAGKDVKDSTVILDEARLYELIRNADDKDSHFLELTFPDPGVQVFAFTFG